ncbi:MAG: CoB--CoM heterodisulfide reductase iron-sulfur subunit A family protein [Deltaproteobacteria bacterium]|nr:CoB--CoM heterodisulfide reductase iron-sulfur subunit A family protein [Deltaproteobacteria bacterium]
MNKKIGKALVVGSGISGIRAALDLAEFGYGVILIDRLPHIGGILSQLDYQFPTNRCGMCKMLPLVDRDTSSQYCLRKGLFHENIEIRLSTELASVEGEPGHFQVTLRQKPRLVDPVLCVGCGECVKVCPVEVPDSFHAGMTTRKAIYLPVPHAIPNPYVIDMDVCTLSYPGGGRRIDRSRFDQGVA